MAQPADVTRWTGQINGYAIAQSIDTCTASVTINTANFVVPGDRVLIHQIYGAEIDTSESSKFGTITSLHEAGLFEFATVDAVVQNKIYLRNRIVNKYSPEHGVQVIRVAIAKNALVLAPITTQPFNGSTGGVIAIEIQDTLFLRSSIIASNIGFRGGKNSINKKDTSELRFRFSPSFGDGAAKGESFVRLTPNQTHGRGNGATGGGGGNARNGGGGGGALGGSGGQGGWQVSQFPFEDVGGKGALPIYDTLNVMRLFFGAGGGGGHENDFQGSSGGNGGGIIIIKASVIQNSRIENQIEVLGTSADNSAGDGAGGGGSGGMVLLEVTTINGRLAINISGGNGGSSTGDDYCYAPGGGGGGGATIITASSAISAADIIVNRSGGVAGQYAGNSNQCSGNPQYGAVDGGLGVVWKFGKLTSGTMPITRTIVSPVANTVCYNSTAEFTVAGGSVRWLTPDVLEQNGRITFTPMLEAKDFVYELTTSTGCVIVDSVRVDVKPIPDTTISGPSTLCVGSSTQFSLKTKPFQRVDWFWNGSPIGNSFPILDSVVSVSATTTGINIISANVTDTNGCSFSIKLNISVADTLKPTIVGDSVLCKNDSLILQVGDYDSYEWSTGQKTPTITVVQPGTYTVRVTSVNCSGTSFPKRIVNGVTESPVLFALKNILEQNDSIIVRTTQPYQRYVWMDGSTEDSIIIRSAKKVFVRVYSSTNCESVSDTITITDANRKPTIVFSTLDVRGFPGEKKLIRIVVSSQDTTRESSTSQGFITTNSTMIVPSVQGFQHLDSVVNIPFLSTIDSGFTGSQYIDIPVTIVLGNTIVDTLFVTDLQSSIPRTELLVGTLGTVTTNGVCEENGRVRLFNPFNTQRSLLYYFDILGRLLSVGVPPKENIFPLFVLPVGK